MSADANELASLHDIVTPAAAPWWPPAPGWYWLMGVAALLSAVLLWRAIAYWQRNRYRREALTELARIETAMRMVQPRDTFPDNTLPAMAELLKRTALTAYPREQVAALTGPAWFAFLDQSGGTTFSAGLGEALAHGNYRTAERTGEREDTSGCSADIAREIRRWIKQHGLVKGTQPAGNNPAAPQSTNANKPTKPTNKKHSTAESA